MIRDVVVQAPTLTTGLAPILSFIKPNQVIVEDEFLNFLVVKIKIMTQDELVLVASNTFDSEWIEASKKTLFELCPDTKQRCVVHKGKTSKNIKSCLKLLNEQLENIPRFVSHNLGELPPVTHNNLDMSEWLHSEVYTLRHTVKLT